MLAIVLALGTSLAYGTSNTLGPRLARRRPLGSVLLAGQLAALVAAVVLVLLAGDAPPTASGIVLGFLAGAGNIWGLAAFYRAAQETSISVVAALGGALGTSLPVVWGVATGDALSSLQAVGIVVAIAGGVVAAQGSVHAVVTPGGIGWSAFSAIGFGTFLIALPRATEHGGTAWALLDARVAVVVFLAAGLLVLRADYGFPARSFPVTAFPGLLLIAGTLMYAEASQRGLLSVVSVLASLATVVTAALSWFTGERLSRVQLVGIGLATLGVVLLAA